MIMCLDIETTFKKDDAYSYNGNNQLVSVGIKTQTGKEDYLWFYHKEREPTKNGKDILQNLLHHSTLLIGHNIKFDLSWLYNCGFTYNNRVFDTMVVEYILSRGIHRDLSLDGSCKRRKVKLKKKYSTESASRQSVQILMFAFLVWINGWELLCSRPPASERNSIMRVLTQPINHVL